VFFTYCFTFSLHIIYLLLTQLFYTNNIKKGGRFSQCPFLLCFEFRKFLFYAIVYFCLSNCFSCLIAVSVYNNYISCFTLYKLLRLLVVFLAARPCVVVFVVVLHRRARPCAFVVVLVAHKISPLK